MQPAPSYCNTGAQNTDPIEKVFKNRVLIDWLEFTMPIHFNWKSLKLYLKKPDAEYTECERGLHGYPRQYLLENIKILTGATDDMGHHVIFSGSAIRALSVSLDEIIHFVFHAGGKFTRCDVACDDFTGQVTVAKCVENLKTGLSTSIFKQFRIMESGTVSTGSYTGQTVYLGSPSSRVLVRIYDKAAEQVTSFNGNFIGPQVPWTRAEIQLRKERAQNFIKELHADGLNMGSLAEQILNKYVQFREKTDDKNKSRRPLCQWWSDFLNTTQKLSLTTEKVIKTAHDVKDWFSRQVAPAFAMLLEAFGPKELQRITLEGRRRMSPRHKEMLTLSKI